VRRALTIGFVLVLAACSATAPTRPALGRRSDDGRSWQRASGDRFRYGQLFGVTATPGGFLATGPSGDLSCLGGMWGSDDGHAWRCVASDPGFAGFAPYAAAASSSVEVAGGLGGGGSPTAGAIWRRSLP
jgi:hypothetical protein